LPRDNPLAIGYPSPPSGWVWTLPDICVINIKHHHLAAGHCPAHNQALEMVWAKPCRFLMAVFDRQFLPLS